MYVDHGVEDCVDKLGEWMRESSSNESFLYDCLMNTVDPYYMDSIFYVIDISVCEKVTYDPEALAAALLESAGSLLECSSWRREGTAIAMLISKEHEAWLISRVAKDRIIGENDSCVVYCYMYDDNIRDREIDYDGLR